MQIFSVTSMRINILKFYQIPEQVFLTKQFSLKVSTRAIIRYFPENATDESI